MNWERQNLDRIIWRWQSHDEEFGISANFFLIYEKIIAFINQNGPSYENNIPISK